MAVLGWALPIELLEGLFAPVEAVAAALLSPLVTLLTPLARLLGALVIDPGFDAHHRTDAGAPSGLLSLLAGGLPLALAITVLVRDQRWRAAALRSQLGTWAGLILGRSPAPVESEAQAAARALLADLGRAPRRGAKARPCDDRQA